MRRAELEVQPSEATAPGLGSRLPRGLDPGLVLLLERALLERRAGAELLRRLRPRQPGVLLAAHRLAGEGLLGKVILSR